jgi:Protein of unknown function (DUF992)
MPISKTWTVCLLAVSGAPWLLGGQAVSRQVHPTHEALTELGVLTCGLAVATDASPASQGRDVLCHFRLGRHGSEETYAGTMQGVGQTEALYRRGVVMLAVKAPAATSVRPGMLQQAYSAGEASPASAAAPLIGETNSMIVLQPLTEEEGRVAVGKMRSDAIIIMVELKLRSSPA